MARVPTVTSPTTLASPVAQPYQRPSFSADQAGPQALGNLAQALGGAGKAVQQQVDITQGLANESMARDADTAYAKQASDLWADYASKEGKDAVAAFPDFTAKLESLRQQTLSTLPNDMVKQMVNQSITSRGSRFYQAGTTYKVEQDKQWSINSAHAAAEQAGNDAMVSRNDFDTTLATINKGVGDLFSASEVKGEDIGTFQVNAAKYRGQQWQNVLQAMAVDDPIKAQAYFDRVRDTMDANSAGNISAYLKPKVLDAKADGIVSSVMGQSGDYYSKIRSAESGGDDQTPNKAGTSTAYGRYQFTGPTWKDMQQHHPELDLTDDGRKDPDQQEKAIHAFTADNQAVLASQLGRAPTDGETYLAHFLGVSDANKVLKADSSTPLSGLIDKDSIAANKSVLEGKTAGDVLAWAQRKMGSPSAIQQNPDDIYAAGLKAAGGDPELQSRVVAKISSQIHVQDVATQTARANLTDNVKATGEALAAGNDVPIPEADIYRLMPQQQADETVQTLKLQGATGQVVKGQQFSSPGEIADTRQAIKDGTSPIVAVADAVGGTDAEKLVRRSQVLDLYDKAVANRDKMIKADPANYALQDPSVRTAMLGASTDPAKYGDYVTATHAVQDRLGIPRGQQRVLTDSMRTNILNQTLQGDPKAGADYLLKLQRQTGTAWGDVFGDLTRGTDGLPSEMMALGIITDPAARTSLTNALVQEHDKPGQMRASIGDANAKDIDTRVENQTADFAATFNVLAGGQEKANALIKSAKMLSYSFVGQGMSPSDAVTRSVSAIQGRYDAMVSSGNYNALAPKGAGGTMASAGNIVKATLQPEQIAPIADVQGIYTPEQRKAAAVGNARQGMWVTSPGGDGWTLLGGDGAIVRRADGKPLTLGYDEAQPIIDAQPSTFLRSETGIVTAPTAPQAAAQTGISEQQVDENARKRAEQMRKLNEGE